MKPQPRAPSSAVAHLVLVRSHARSYLGHTLVACDGTSATSTRYSRLGSLRTSHSEQESRATEGHRRLARRGACRVGRVSSVRRWLGAVAGCGGWVRRWLSTAGELG